MKIKISLKPHIDVLLVAIVLNANVLRYFMNINDTNIAFNVIYIACVAVLFYEYGTSVFRNNKLTIITGLGSVISLYALVSCVWNGTDNIINVVKLIVCFMLLILTYMLDEDKIVKVINLTLIINVIYSIYVLINPTKIGVYLRAGSFNYLTMTLTLGMSMTISLVSFVCSLYAKLKIRDILFWLLLSSFYLVVLTQFLSRGAILLPILCVAIVVLVIGIKKKLKSITVIGVVAIIGYFAFQYYINNVSSYALSRMTRLFTDLQEEDRFGLWSQAINTINRNAWFIIGGGVNAFKVNVGFYPHNYFIQMLGEFGVLGLALAVSITGRCFSGFIKANKNLGLTNSQRETILYSTFAVMLYLLLTFCKSFSMYDAYPLYIFFALSLKTCDEVLSNNSTLGVSE